MTNDWEIQCGEHLCSVDALVGLVHETSCFAVAPNCDQTIANWMVHSHRPAIAPTSKKRQRHLLHQSAIDLDRCSNYVYRHAEAFVQMLALTMFETVFVLDLAAIVIIIDLENVLVDLA